MRLCDGRVGEEYYLCGYRTSREIFHGTLKKAGAWPEKAACRGEYTERAGFLLSGKKTPGRPEADCFSENTVRRLEALGLVEGTAIHILHKKTCGTLILRVRGTRLALGRRITENMVIREASVREKGWGGNKASLCGQSKLRKNNPL